MIWMQRGDVAKVEYHSMTIKKTMISAAAALTVSAIPLAMASAQGKPDVDVRARQLIERFDADNDNRVTLEEYLSVQDRRFVTADENADGFVTLEELISAVDEVTGRRGNRKFDRLDTDRDGRISAAEAEATGAINAGRRLVRLDADRDGFVTRTELGALRNKIVLRHGGRMMERLDRDRDGRISADEAGAIRKQQFISVDADKDGIVTLAELTAGMKEQPDAVDE